MSFISFAFMVFLPCAVLCNFIVPIKYRYIWLLIASMIFYSTAGLGAVVVLVLSMLSVYATGIGLGKKKTKLIFLLCLIDRRRIWKHSAEQYNNPSRTFFLHT